MQTPIPLICDRCRAEGAAGEDPFVTYADLLDFEPVPRRPRADGWDAEVQRAFIAMLAATGSPRQAAAAVGKAQFGVDQLKKAKGNESFMAAYDRAMAFFAENRSQRLAEGVRAATAALPRPPRPAWGHAATREILPGPGWGTARSVVEGVRPANDDEKGMSIEDKLDWLDRVVDLYLIKVDSERKERLAGNIVAADFYLRQATHIEVTIDLIGTDGFRVLLDYRKGDHAVAQIAETPFSQLFGEARRAKWAELGEPPRPEHPPRHRLVEQDGYSIEPLEFTRGGLEQSHDEQRAAFTEEHRRQAELQIQWEAEARADFERRQSQRSPDSGPGPIRNAAINASCFMLTDPATGCVSAPR